MIIKKRKQHGFIQCCFLFYIDYHNLKQLRQLNHQMKYHVHFHQSTIKGCLP